MKIINRTKWDTNDLRKLCSAVIKRCGSESKNHIIYVQTIKHRWSTYAGCAFVGGRTITMKVPKITKVQVVSGSDGTSSTIIVPNEFESNTFASVLEHEINHNLGLRHKVMGELHDHKWAEEYKVRIQEEKAKPVRDLKKERYDKALKKVKVFETKLKRDKTLLDKWKKKVKYYQKGEVN